MTQAYIREVYPMGTIIVFLILAFVIVLVIRSMIKDKKAGKSLQCGQDCNRCGGCCHHTQNH